MNETDWSVTKEHEDAERDEANRLYIVEALSSDGCYSASVKWDGCVDLHKEGSVNNNHLHLCGPAELDAMIERLTKLRALAREKFGDHWYGEWSSGDVKS